jgi:hypothetical protein
MLRTQRLFVWIFVLLEILLPSLQSCSPFLKRGAATREEVVNIYLSGLEAKDEQAILMLIPEDYEADQAVKEKIERLSDRTLEQRTITYQELQKPSSVKVTIEGTYYDKPIPNGRRFQSKDQIFIHAANQRWYLILGEQIESVE